MKKCFRIAILFLFLFSLQESVGQRRKIDSLQKLLVQRKDTLRIKTLLSLAGAYRRVNLDSAINCATTALKESRERKYEYGIYYGTYKLGDYFRERGDFARSIESLDQCLEIAIKTKDTVGMGQTYNSIGNTYNKTGDFPKALAAFQNSLKIKEKRNDKNGMANTYINIGNIYDGMSIYDKAEEYILKGIALKKEVGDAQGAAGALNNLSIIYTRTKRVNKAIIALESILRDFKIDIEPYLRSAVLGNLAEAYQRTGQLSKAIAPAKECLKIREELGDSTEISYSLITLGDIELDNGNYEEAIAFVERALKMGKKMGMLSHVWDAHISLGEIYAAKGDYKTSVDHYREVIKLSDTLINSRAFTIIHEMDAKYESDKKEAEISKLNTQKKIAALEMERKEADISRQRWIMVFGALLILCMIAVSVMIFRSYKEKQRSNEKLQSAYNIIEEKQKEILDSIYYARRIQSSLFTSEKYIERTIARLKKKM